MVNSPSWAACSSSHNVSYPAPLRVKRRSPIRATLQIPATTRDAYSPSCRSQERQGPQDRHADPCRTEGLERHLERHREVSAMLMGLWEENGLVFPNRLGKPMDHNNIYHREVKRVR